MEILDAMASYNISFDAIFNNGHGVAPSSHFVLAASIGNLAALKWIQARNPMQAHRYEYRNDKGNKVRVSAITKAAENGHALIVQYLHMLYFSSAASFKIMQSFMEPRLMGSDVLKKPRIIFYSPLGATSLYNSNANATLQKKNSPVRPPLILSRKYAQRYTDSKIFKEVKSKALSEENTKILTQHMVDASHDAAISRYSGDEFFEGNESKIICMQMCHDAVMGAIKHGRTEVATYFLQAGYIFEERHLVVAVERQSLAMINLIFLGKVALNQEIFDIALRQDNEMVALHLLNLDRGLAKSVSKNGLTVAMRAAMYGHFNLLNYLIDHCHIDISNEIDLDGDTALDHAICNRSENNDWIVRLLCYAGIPLRRSPNFFEKEEYIILAAKEKQWNLVKVLSEYDAYFKEICVRESAEYFLHICADSLDVRLLFSILDNGADIQRRDASGNTIASAVICACFVNTVSKQNTCIEILKMLRLRGADMQATNVAGENLISTAAEVGCALVIQWLVEECCLPTNIEHIDGGTPLTLAALNDHLDAVKNLCFYGVDLTSEHYFLAMSKAVVNKNIDVFNWMFDRAAPSKKDFQDDPIYGSILEFSIKADIHAVVLAFHARGACFSEKFPLPGKNEFYPVAVAIRSAAINTLRTLCTSLGPDILQATGGDLPLGLALKIEGIDDMKEIMSLLLDHGNDINTPGADGMSVLTLAVTSQSNDIIPWLCHRRARIDHRDAQERTPLDYAISYGNIRAVQALCAYGAIITAMLPRTFETFVPEENAMKMLDFLSANAALGQLPPVGHAIVDPDILPVRGPKSSA